MINLLTPLLARIVGGRSARAASWVLVIPLAAFLLWRAYDWAYDHGVAAERAAWHRAAQTMKARRIEAAAKADARDAGPAAQARAKISEERKDLDNATQALPDHAPSARARERIDRELRRDAAQGRD